MVIKSEQISANLKNISTEDLKKTLIYLTQEKDPNRLNQKVKFYQDTLAPLFEELSDRNPYPQAEEQISLIGGIWIPIWSTIPYF